MQSVNAIPTIDLPVIRAGSCRYAAPADDVHHLRYESGIAIRVPALTREDIELISAARRAAWRRLAKLTTGELTMFLQEVGERWLTRSADGRRLVDAHAHR